jgi:magnesium-transporting ATPase (P-type)
MNYAAIEAEQALVQSAVAIGEFQATHVAIFLTVLFAYIVVAFVAGAQLNRLQLVITNLLFIIVSAYQIAIIASANIASGKAMAKLAEFSNETVVSAPGVGTAWPDILMWGSGVVAGLVFMWSVRRSNK